MFLAILLVTLLIVSAVSAADNATEDIVGVEETTDEVVGVENDNQVIDSVDFESNLLSANSDGTFTDLANEINNANGTLYLTKNYVYDSSKDSRYIRIEKEITINGKGFTINGDNKARAFIISSSNVQLRNIKFSDCYEYNSKFGAIYWYGADGVLSDCSFVNCHCSESGGAVYWSGNNGKLSDCSFINCYSSSSGLANSRACSMKSSSYGGAVYWSGVGGNLINSSFNSCYCSSSSSGSGSGSTSTEGSRVSYSYGGAIYWASSGGNLINCCFDTCHANSQSSGYSIGHVSIGSSSYGGAIYLSGVNGNLINSSFNTCYCYSSSSGTYSSYGGTIYWSGSKGNILSCNFNNFHISPSSSDNGRAIYWVGDKGYMFNCSFDGNYYNYQQFCNSKNNVMPVFLIYKSALDNDGRIVIFESTPLVNNITVSLYDVTNRIILYKQFNISSGDLTYSFTVNDLEEGEYQIVLEYGGDSFYSATSANDLFKIGKNSTFEVTVNDIIGIGDNVTLNLTLNGDATGQVKITTSDYTCINELVDGKTSFNIPYETGKHDEYKIKYAGDDKYNPIYISNPFTILYKSDICLDLNDTYVFDENIPLIYNLTSDCTGTISVFVDDVFKANASVDDLFELENIDAGEHNITVIYNGDKYYTTCSDSAALAITKADPSIAVNSYNMARDLIMEIALNEKATGDINVTINKKVYSANLTDGKANITISNLAPGNYKATITYPGNDNYNPATTTAQVTVDKYDTFVSANDVTVYQGDANGKLIATLTNDQGVPLSANMVVTLNGIDYTLKSNSKGQISVSTADLAQGTYTATIAYSGNSKYAASSTTAQVIVNKKLSTIVASKDVSVYYGDSNGKLIATLTNGEGVPLSANLVVTLNGVTYSQKSNSKGQISVSTADLNPGTYTATIAYNGNSKYAPSSTTAKVTVTNKLVSVVTADDVTVRSGDANGKLIATLTNVEGVPLSANIVISLNGIDYAMKTNSKGQASVSTKDLAPGTYTATVTYKGNSKYAPSSTTAKVTVTNRLESIVSAEDITVKCGDANGKLVATLTNAEGTPLSANIVISLNGVTYSMKTNSKGQASVSTADLAIGEYIATIIYKGNSKYDASSTIAKVTVTNKQVSIVSADDVTVKYGDSNSKFVATLTNAEDIPLSANMVVTLNGVEHTLKSNSKGQVSVSTAGLAMGEYTATVVYKGNSKYNPASTTAKVVVNNKLTSCISGVYNAEKKEVIGTLTNSAGTPLSANVVISLNDVDYTMKSDSKGQFKVSTEMLAPGKYVAKLVYKGNSKYNPSSTAVNVVIS